MKEESIPSVSPQEINKPTLFTPHGIALIVMWILTTAILVVMLFGGVRSTRKYGDERKILQIGYVLTLFWYLIQTGPSVKNLPAIRPHLFTKLTIGKLIPVIVIALLFVFEFFGQGLLLTLLIPATIWILIAWRREISLSAVLLGLAVAMIAFWGGLGFYQNQYIGELEFFLFLLFVIPMFVAGGLLNKRTGLVGSQLYIGQYKKAGVSFLWGCLLFIPLGLTNAATGSPGPWMTWVNRWWLPWSQSFFSGIVEEAWWRLFLVSLSYLLLRPAFNKYPVVAIICATLFSAIPFGLGHGGTLQERFLIIGLLYGLPLAVAFVKRDWEHTIGAHYMINMIPTLMVFLET